MPRKPKSALSPEDVKFLKAAEEINSNPDQYPDTDISEVPANTRNIPKITDLSSHQVGYRIRPDERGLESMGYVELHDALPGQAGTSPRSVEITDEGLRAIQQWQENYTSIGVGDSDTQPQTEFSLDLEGGDTGDLEDALTNLQSKIEHLSNRIDHVETSENIPSEVSDRLDSIESDVDQIRAAIQGEYGAVDDVRAERLSQTIDLVILYHNIFQDVFGIPMEEINEEISFEEAEARVRDHLGIEESDFAPIEESESSPMDIDDE